MAQARYYDCNVSAAFHPTLIQGLLDSGHAGIVWTENKAYAECAARKSWGFVFVPPPLLQEHRGANFQLRRTNVVLGGTGSQGVTIAKFSGHDILSVTPSTHAELVSACQNWKVDIIALDLTAPLSSWKLRGHFAKAVERGIYFEITVRPALYDRAARRTWMANVYLLLRHVKKSHILLSTGAESATELKSPGDLCHMLRAFGVAPATAARFLSDNPEALFSAVALKRHAFRGCVVSAPGGLKAPFPLSPAGTFPETR